jgi:hypothetical protein
MNKLPVGTTVRYSWTDGTIHDGVIKKWGTKWVELTNSSTKKSDWVAPGRIEGFTPDLVSDSPKNLQNALKVVDKITSNGDIIVVSESVEVTPDEAKRLAASLYNLVKRVDNKTFRKVSIGSNFFKYGSGKMIAKVLPEEIEVMLQLNLIKIIEEGPIGLVVEPSLASQVIGSAPPADLIGVIKFEVIE